MQNANRTGNNPGFTNNPENLADDIILDETREENSEASKEADTKPEDFESFNVDKVDELEKIKEESDGPEEE